MCGIVAHLVLARIVGRIRCGGSLESVVNKGLKVPYFNPMALMALNRRAQLEVLVGKLSQQILNCLIVQKFFLRQPEDLEGLLLGHEAAFYPKALISHLLATAVADLLHLQVDVGQLLEALPAEEATDLAHATLNVLGRMSVGVAGLVAGVAC